MGQSKNGTGKKSRLRFLCLALSLLSIWWLGSFFKIDTAGFERALKGLAPVYGALAFILLYVGVTFFVWFSKDVFKFLGAFVFGACVSTYLIWVAEAINACILFGLARYLGREFIEKSYGQRHRKFEQKVAGVSFFWLLLFRAVPLIPFRFLDLAAGLTALPFRRYFAAVILGSPLRIFWVQYVIEGVGRGIFNNPSALSCYLLQQKGLLIGSFAYLVLVAIVAVKLMKKKG
ncbi:MAG: VTT domain-containing protein [Candidatus Omnitrophota bacterium]